MSNSSVTGLVEIQVSPADSEIAFRLLATSLLIVAITRAFCAQAFYRGKGQIDIAGLELMGRSSIDQYLVVDGEFTVARPNTGEVI